MEYGKYDIERIVSKSRSTENSGLAFDKGAVWAIEQLLLAKHHMTEQVYFHRVRLISDEMIVRGIKIGAREDSKIESMFKYREEDEFLTLWKNLDDRALSRKILNCKSDKAKKIYKRLKNRNLLKRVVNINISNIRDISKKDALSKLDEESKKEAEKAIANKINSNNFFEKEIKDWEVIINKRKLGEVPMSRNKFRIDTDTILIKDEDGHINKYSERPETTNFSPNKNTFLHVYMPIPIEERPERESLIQDMNEVTQKAIFEII